MVCGYSKEMFTREDANPEKFIEQAAIEDWSRQALSKSIALLSEQKKDSAFEKLIETVIEEGLAE